MHGCPYCDYFKVNCEKRKTSTRGKYQEVDGNKIVMRTWKNIELPSENYRLHGGGIRKNLQEHKNVEHKAIQLKTISNVNEEVILTLPPEPLHTNLLGPINDALELLEKLHPEEFKKFYKKHGLKKSGDGPGGKFNGPKVKHIIKEKTLDELENILPKEEYIFISYLRSIRELHRVSITSNFEEAEAELALFDFEHNFFNLYEIFGLNMTLKIHIIIHHYRWYFTNTGIFFKDTNGEFGETVHSTLKKFELGRGFKVSRRIGTDHHLLKAHQSISSFNALKMGGTPAKSMSIRKRKTSTSSSPSSSPRSSPTSTRSASTSWAFRKNLLNYHCLSPLSK